MVDLFVVLGAAIVKASVKLWLKDNDFAADIGASLTDLISGRISGQYDQRKVRRIFEDLDETVGRRLESLRQTEFGRLPENEWNAAVIAAGISFDRSQLSAAELFTRDLDPLFLERYTRRGNPRATRDLSEGGAELYDRLISEGCAYVIEIADKLPRFQTMRSPNCFIAAARRSTFSTRSSTASRARPRAAARKPGSSPPAAAG